MAYFFFTFAGLICGAIGVYVALDSRRRRTADLQLQLTDSEARLREAWKSFKIKHQQGTDAIEARQNVLVKREEELEHRTKQFDMRAVTFEELTRENAILRRDLHNLDVKVRKLALDTDVQRETQEFLDERSRELGSRYLKETIKWIGTALSPNNYAVCKQRLVAAIEWCRKIGFSVSADDEIKCLADLKSDYELVVRAALEREEQARIRAIMREEQLRLREIDREKRQVEREREVIQIALAKAQADAMLAHDQQSAEVEMLRKRLQEVEERQRAISQAQITKAGHVYVISNIGSFGHGVFKIGLTRRLEPVDRIKELSGAAVPFPFDVHMMISSNNAPALEHSLHKEFHRKRVNKANPRKEYFKVELEDIRRVVAQNHGEISYVADPAALEYNQSLTMSDEDQEFIESVYESLEGDEDIMEDEVT